MHESRLEQIDLAELDRTELESALLTRGQPRFRAAQIQAWLDKRGVTDFAAIERLRSDLAGRPIDILISNAAIGLDAMKIGAIDYNRVRQMFEINTIGALKFIETFVDDDRPGTSYRAANWIALGSTTGRGRMDRHHRREGLEPKQLFVYPLHPKACAILRGEAGVPAS